MAFDFHHDRNKYFQLQYQNTKKNIIPFIENVKSLTPQLRILEIGCRDGGVLKPFLELGCHVTGFDLEEAPILEATQRYKQEIQDSKAEFFVMNVHDYIAKNKENESEKFDLVILKDVIEHIHEREAFFSQLHFLLKKGGVIFFGFPPWMNPFGGHQQVLSHKVLSKIPYIHLLPDFIYFNLLEKLQPSGVHFVKDIKATRLTIEKFEQLVNLNNFEIKKRTLYFVAPMYEYKFGLNSRRLVSPFKNIPWIRNYYTTVADYIISLR